jgi:predicted MPP superfamily phosphohydrolase
MTPDRFAWAMALFHGVALVLVWAVARRWRERRRCARPGASWLMTLAVDVGVASVIAYLAALTVAVAANAGALRRLHLGSISGLLMGQALFAEGALLAFALAVRHGRAERSGRAWALTAVSASLAGVYAYAFHVEPRQLQLRRHVVDLAPGGDARSIRILHLTDIQTPAIGEHEERALRMGLSQKPDLIVLTGDYVQNELGRATTDRAASDLRALMTRVRFDAPLGVYATEGDAGPPCGEVFAGTHVRCLVDANAVVTLPGGGTLGITGLSRPRGRERDPAWLGWLLSRGPSADHRIVISHAPDFVDAMPVDVDLVLAGHTHGGQVVVPFFGPPVTAMRLPRRYAGGLHDYEGTPLHVSRGVGMERGFAPQLRFLCPPEVCVVDLRVRRPVPGNNPGRVRVGFGGPGAVIHR